MNKYKLDNIKNLPVTVAIGDDVYIQGKIDNENIDILFNGNCINEATKIQLQLNIQNFYKIDITNNSFSKNDTCFDKNSSKIIQFRKC